VADKLTQATFQIVVPKMVGGYRLGKGLYSWLLKLEHKPRWFHRTCMKFFFGISWEDE